jgi:lipopolysaccharide/colanic/teichoic acid biosynthesis glycosyltransferase
LTQDTGFATPNGANVTMLYSVTKRATDLIGAATILVVGSPLWALISMSILAGDGRPVFYRGTVAGERGQPFRYYKFRTMRGGDNSPHREWLADFVLRDQPSHTHGDVEIYKSIDHSRVTRVGRWLRRTGLDEVPQLVNVLKGDMSIVGPRPPLLEEYQHYDERARQRLAVKPGITGLYQVTARSRVPFSRMLTIDLDYIERRSWWLDFSIMLKTVGVMLRGDGAH